MNKNAGYSVIEILVVVLILSILATLSIISLGSHNRMVKTEDGAGAIFSIMRQARVQSITRRQFYAIVINTAGAEQSVKVHTSSMAKLMLKFPAQSVTLVDMGTQDLDDETITLTKKLPVDVVVNANSGLPVNTAFPVPERNFTTAAFNNGIFICYFDPAGRAVNNCDGTGTQVYTTFYFSSFDINSTVSAPLLRAVTVYGATGGVKFWRYIPTPPSQWVTQLN